MKFVSLFASLIFALVSSAFAEQANTKRIICSIKDFTIASLGKDRMGEAEDVGLTETPKELIIPDDADKSEDGNFVAWSENDTKHLYFTNEREWHLAYMYYGTSRIVSINAVRVCDEF